MAYRRLCAAIVAAAIVASSARADEAAGDPPGSAGNTDPVLRNVLGGILIAFSLAFMVEAVAASGDEVQRKEYSAPYDYMMAALSPLGGAGCLSIATGFGALGTYNLVNHDRPSTRRWVNGAGMLASFLAADVERSIETRSSRRRDAHRLSWKIGVNRAALQLRF